MRKYKALGTRSIQISLSLPQLVLERVNRLATEKKMSRGELILMLLDEWTAHKDKEAKKTKPKRP